MELLTLQVDLQLDVVDRLVVLLLEVGQNLLVVLDAFGFKGLKGIHQNDPGADAAAKVLGVERAQRDVLPGLDVSCRPVVQHDQAEQVVFCLGDGDRLAQLIRLADEGAELQLVVEPLDGSKGRHLVPSLRVGQVLAVRTTDRGA